MNTYTEALEQVINALNANFNKSNAENVHNLNNFLSDIELIEQIYELIDENKSKDVLAEAQSDLLNSLVFCFQGYYRHANICLRSSIELILSFLYYYDHQYDFVLWQNDCIDMTWTQLTNQEKGVFNDKFLSIINGKDITINKCLEEFKELYHLTFQYVHGKYEYMQKMLSSQVKYSQTLVDQYFNISDKILKLEIIVLYLRFVKEIKSCLDPDNINKIETWVKKYEVIKDE